MVVRATVLHITQTRYLVYISLINYVFSFCTVRFGFSCWQFLFVGFVRCRSSFTSPFPLLLLLLHSFERSLSLYRRVSSCLLIELIYARFDFEMSDDRMKWMRKCFANELRAHAASLLINALNV